MDRKIVDPDPGLNYNAAVCTGDPHFVKLINIHPVAVQIVARLQILMLDDVVLSLENLVKF